MSEAFDRIAYVKDQADRAAFEHHIRHENIYPESSLPNIWKAWQAACKYKDDEHAKQ